MIEDMRRDR